MGNEPLLLAKKAEEMVLYGYQVLRHFPRSERHVLSQEIRQSMWAVLALIERAARATGEHRYVWERLIVNLTRPDLPQVREPSPGEV